MSILATLPTEWDSVTTHILQLSTVFILVLLNAFFVAAEFALVKIRSSQVENMNEKHKIRLRVVVSNLDSYLSGCQLGITLASLALGWVGEPCIAHLVSPLLHHIGITSDVIIHGISILVAFSVITICHITFGEQVPKIFAIRKPLETAAVVVLPLMYFQKVLKPAIYVLNIVSNFILLKLFGLKCDGHETPHTPEELMSLVEESAVASHLSHDESKMVGRVFELKDTNAVDIMTPRRNVVSMLSGTTVVEALKIAAEHGYSRYPVINGELDRIDGIVNLKDLINSKDLVINPRKVKYFPQMVSIDKIMNSMRIEKYHMAVLVDEFGGTSGIITLEDILEQVVGDIQDEHDIEKPLFVKNGDSFNFKGEITIRDVEQLLGIELGDDSSTISGWLVAKFGHIPKSGEEIISENITFTIMSSNERQILEVKAGSGSISKVLKINELKISNLENA